jgi:DNA-binding phage protein
MALKNVLEAQGGDMSAIAEEANLNRQNIYRMLSEKGNPRWNNLKSLINTIGLDVQLSTKK